MQLPLSSFLFSFMIYPFFLALVIGTFLSVPVLRVHAAAETCVVTIDESVIKLPLTASINRDYVKNLLENDRTRVRVLIQNAMRQTTQESVSGLQPRQGSGNIFVVNNAVQYTAVVAIGNPPSQYNLLIDTGSSNTWVGSGKAYVPTSTSYKTKNNVSVIYGSGDFSGVEYLDQVSLGPNLLIHNQSIGVATEYEGFGSIDGILGMGPVGLTVGTLTPDSSRVIPTVVQKLFSQKTIARDGFSVYFAPTNSTSATNGELTFGGVDFGRLTANITYTSIPTEGTASQFWGLRQSIVYDKSKQILNNGTGFYDTGTTLILLNDDSFDGYVASTNASLDPTVGLLQISEDQYATMKSLYFFIDNTKFELTPNAQIWPRSLNGAIGGSDDKIYLIVSSLGSAANGAPDVQFVNGYTFLERFYTTYDISKRRIGVAPTKFTYAETN